MKKEDLQIYECQRLCNYQECPHRNEDEIPDDWLLSMDQVVKDILPSHCKYFEAIPPSIYQVTETNNIP